jgi:hypothetical protein
MRAFSGVSGANGLTVLVAISCIRIKYLLALPYA